MDFELRNLKDFLGLYNKVTELCFSSCVDNFFARDLTQDEIRCAENCVGKFTNTNQRLLQVYMGVQGEINQRRLEEVEAQQAKLVEEASRAQEQQQLQQQDTVTAGSQLVEGAPSSGTSIPSGETVGAGSLTSVSN